MKTLRVILGGTAIVALLGVSAMADVQNVSALSAPVFSLDIGSGADMQDISFGTSDNSEESQTTCAMTPGGASMGMLYEDPVINPIDEPERYTNSPQISLASINSFRTPGVQNTTPGYPYNPNPAPAPPTDGTTPGTEPPVVPEPATLMLFGIGIGAVFATRRREKGE